MDKCSYINGLCDGGKTLFNFIKNEGLCSVYDSSPKFIKGFIQSYAKDSVISLVDKLSIVFGEPCFKSEVTCKLGINLSLGDYVSALYRDKSGIEVVVNGLSLLDLVMSSYTTDSLDFDSYNDGVRVVFDKCKELPSVVSLIFGSRLKSLRDSLRLLKKECKVVAH